MYVHRVCQISKPSYASLSLSRCQIRCQVHPPKSKPTTTKNIEGFFGFGSGDGDGGRGFVPKSQKTVLGQMQFHQAPGQPFFVSSFWVSCQSLKKPWALSCPAKPYREWPSFSPFHTHRHTHTSAGDSRGQRPTEAPHSTGIAVPYAPVRREPLVITSQ